MISFTTEINLPRPLCGFFPLTVPCSVLGTLVHICKCNIKPLPGDNGSKYDYINILLNTDCGENHGCPESAVAATIRANSVIWHKSEEAQEVWSGTGKHMPYVQLRFL